MSERLPIIIKPRNPIIIEAKPRNTGDYQAKIHNDALNEPALEATIDAVCGKSFERIDIVRRWVIAGFKRCPGMTVEEAVTYCLDNKDFLDF